MTTQQTICKWNQLGRLNQVKEYDIVKGEKKVVCIGQNCRREFQKLRGEG